MAKIRMNSLKYHQLVVGIQSIRANQVNLINLLSNLKTREIIILDRSSKLYRFIDSIMTKEKVYEILDNYYNISFKDKNSKFISETDFVEVEYKEVINMLNDIDTFDNERSKTCKNIKTAKKFLIEFFRNQC